MNLPRVGIGVLIFNKQRLLLGMRQKDHGSQTWSPPGGHLEFGETLEECAIRETQEETGLTISNPKFCTLTNDVFPIENKHYVSIFFTTHHPEPQLLINLEPEKVRIWEWFPVHALPEQLFLPLKNLLAINGTDFLIQTSIKV